MIVCDGCKDKVKAAKRINISGVYPGGDPVIRLAFKIPDGDKSCEFVICKECFSDIMWILNHGQQDSDTKETTNDKA